ncbi:hypothetical protein L4C34_02950 [Vibrio profundum]|uniref:hypothetical protein n=1 Tax=Vibrio profundum TaxID=2910247 RepID=UPI003D1501A0
MQITENNHSFSRSTKASEDQTSSDSDRQEAFSKVLKKKSKPSGVEPVPMAVLFMQEINKQAILEKSNDKSFGVSDRVIALQAVGCVYHSKDIYIKRVGHQSINVRLMSGPFSGLEIQASIHVGKIEMRLKSANDTHKKQLARRLDKLECKLNQFSQYRVEIQLEKVHGK